MKKKDWHVSCVCLMRTGTELVVYLLQRGRRREWIEDWIHDDVSSRCMITISFSSPSNSSSVVIFVPLTQSHFPVIWFLFVPVSPYHPDFIFLHAVVGLTLCLTVRVSGSNVNSDLVQVCVHGWEEREREMSERSQIGMFQVNRRWDERRMEQTGVEQGRWNQESEWERRELRIQSQSVLGIRSTFLSLICSQTREPLSHLFFFGSRWFRVRVLHLCLCVIQVSHHLVSITCCCCLSLVSLVFLILFLNTYLLPNLCVSYRMKMKTVKGQSVQESQTCCHAFLFSFFLLLLSWTWQGKEKNRKRDTNVCLLQTAEFSSHHNKHHSASAWIE
jgi:hypothetical protein